MPPKKHYAPGKKYAPDNNPKECVLSPLKIRKSCVLPAKIRPIFLKYAPRKLFAPQESHLRPQKAINVQKVMIRYQKVIYALRESVLALDIIPRVNE